jgi:molecular chaperone HtpG
LDAILPKWLRFVQGVLDTSSLDLNVSRELIQSSPFVGKIKKAITKRVISELKKAMKKDPKAYDAFWEQFGKVLKEGLYEDIENRDKVADITRVFSSTADANITLQGYVDAFAAEQKDIYYLAADSLDQAKQSAHLEGFQARGIDVLLMTDPIDTFWMSQMGKFKEFNFVSIVRDQYDIDGIGSQDAEGENQEKANESEIIAVFKAHLSDLLEDVKASATLRQSPVRLVAGTAGLDFNLERILKAQNPNFEGGKKILEINLGHELIKKLASIKDEDIRASLCRVLLEQAKILDGELPADPQTFSNDIVRLGLASAG